jgi:hypothetical protein
VTWPIVGLLVGYSIWLRFALAWGLPLWLDETWTAAISGSPDFRTLWHNIWLDGNGPLYYVLMWLWPFHGDFGLKFPSLVFVIAAAALAVVWRPGRVSLLWAVLLLLWAPGINFSVEARTYALLFLLSVLQTVTFVRLLEAPTTRRAAAWVGVASLAFLAHYYAAAVCLTQGLAYLWMHRERALRTWPAGLLLAPAIGWFAYHLPQLILYAQRPWYALVGAADWAGLMLWTIGGTTICAVGMLAIVGLFFQRPPREILATAAAGWVAAALLVVAGLLRPMLVDRYILPSAPPILLGVAASIRFNGYLPLAVWMTLSLSTFGTLRDRLIERAWYGLELPAREMPNARIVTWYSDNPRGVLLLDRNLREAVLSDSFARNGRSIEARWGTNLTDGDGLIWIYDKSNKATADAIRRSWRCVTHNRSGSSILACERAAR